MPLQQPSAAVAVETLDEGVAVADRAADAVVLVQAGDDGRFGAVTSVPVGDEPVAIAAATAEGLADREGFVAVADQGSNDVAMFSPDFEPVVAKRVRIAGPPASVAMAVTVTSGVPLTVEDARSRAYVRDPAGRRLVRRADDPGVEGIVTGPFTGPVATGAHAYWTHEFLAFSRTSWSAPAAGV